ncbi:MAG: [Fe-Fe] hydrogenase large subunit C-terminal domain-containing protein [Myxococcota bacterium]|jgi:signal transduction histidine kinase/Pyruvate/2-oxoacid:ferredoxin oxidoreductase delta subunit
MKGAGAPGGAPATSDMQPQTCFVKTVKNKCRVCYTCVRKCPAKAIRILKSQAEVVPERCIGCGSCVRFCSQHAKQVVSTVQSVCDMLQRGEKVVACLAPSFPVEFGNDVDFRVLVGMIRQLGFAYVAEVAFGADLVAERYRKLLVENKGQQYIATTCPAVVGYVEKYQPTLVKNLAPLVSPMVATARAMRVLKGSDLKVVFIGPCIAKKVEGCDPDVGENIDEVITFLELREMFLKKQITPDKVEPSDFDPPHPSLGALFPLTRGLLQSAGIPEDLLTGDVVVTEGSTNFTCAVGEFAAGNLEANLVELLACSGCIAGPATTSRETLFKRRARVSHYVRYRMSSLDHEQWVRTVNRLAKLDLTRTFSAKDQRISVLDEGEIRAILNRMGKRSREDELNCGACGYLTCRDHAVAIYKGLAESEMCLPFVIDEHQKTIRELSLSNDKLASAQETLMHSERLASMGQLAAGVAHELNNPLGVVLMYTHLLLDECDTNSALQSDLKMIADQADRCKRIVAGLLDFARQNKVAHQSVDLCQLAEETLRSLPPPEGVNVKTEHDNDDHVADIDRDQVIQILINLIVNAYDAMPSGGKLTLKMSGDEYWAMIEVVDTGTGIPRENLKKIFEPFFTTKLMGKGTGLGLAVVYGIVKMHRGDISVTSNSDPDAGPTGTSFVVKLPKKQRGN